MRRTCLALQDGIEPPELGPGVVGREGPGDGALLVALGFQGCYPPLECRPVSRPSLEAFPPDNRDLDLGHVQPTPMDRLVVKLQLPQDPTGSTQLEGTVERAGEQAMAMR